MGQMVGFWASELTVHLAKSAVPPRSEDPLPPTSLQIGSRKGYMLLVSQERSGLQIQSHENVLPPSWNTVETALQGAFALLIPLELNEVLALLYIPGIEIKRVASKPSSLVPVCGGRREQGPLWPGYQLPWPSLWLLQLQGSGGIAAPAASISFSCKACTTPFGEISPVMLSYELETPYQCHIMRRRRLCPNATVSGTAEPEASLTVPSNFFVNRKVSWPMAD